MKKINVLIVVDMQNDFTYGALRNEEGIAIIPKVVNKIKQYIDDPNGVIIFTQDTHTEDYLESEEGKNLPVVHCVYNTEGWELVDEIKKLYDDYHDNEGNVTKMACINKPTFGAIALGDYAFADLGIDRTVRSIDQEVTVELVGLCTDICVISNAVMAKSFLPDAHIVVDASCCAGVTPESHKTALEAMKAIQVEVINEEEEN